MKRYHDLYPTLASFENLWLAAHKAARGKRGQPAVAAFDFNLEDELLRCTLLKGPIWQRILGIDRILTAAGMRFGKSC